jgi:hypothetical protein
MKEAVHLFGLRATDDVIVAEHKARQEAEWAWS